MSKSHRRELNAQAAAAGSSGPAATSFGSNAEMAAALGAAPASRVLAEFGKLGGPAHVATIYFETDSAEVDAEDRSVLQMVAATYDEAMKAGGEGTIYLDGYADYRGTEQHNDGLSGRRASAAQAIVEPMFKFPPKFAATGWGEESKNRSAMDTDRRVDVVADIRPYDPAAERAEAESSLDGMLAAAIPVLQARGDLHSVEGAVMCALLRNPSIDDRIIDAGPVERFTKGRAAQAGRSPDEFTTSARRRVLDAVRYADGDVDKFADQVVIMVEGVHAAYGEMSKAYRIDGDTNVAAVEMQAWLDEQTRNPASVLYAFSMNLDFSVFR